MIIVFYWKSDRQALKVMLLQLRKRRSSFMTSIHRDFVQKRRRGASELAKKIKQHFLVEMDKTGWTYVPRAKLAVTMSFYPRDNKIPTLHNLVKFYLDTLRSVVFNDDRQVGCLVAKCWRTHEPSQNLDEKDASVFIEVERLTDYKRRFDLYFALMKLEEFRDHLKWDYRYQHLIDEDDELDILEDLRLDKATADFLGLSDEARENIHRFEMMNLQEQQLSLNRIDDFDRPGGPKLKYSHLERAMLHGLPPFTVDLGDLPAKGKSDEYKRRIRERFQKLRSEHRLFRQILVPVELDVQITPRSLKLGKDLDNIMRDIVPALKEELLRGEAYLHGYRIYVTDKLFDDNSSGSIRIKLLPMGAISSFYDAMDETFTAGKEWLENQLR